MPVKIDEKLPAFKFLEQENIFVMTKERAMTQDVRPLSIAILNLMPNKIVTETQLLRLIGNSPLQVEVTLLRTASYESKNTAEEHLSSFYMTFSEAMKEGKKFDGLIITGAPVEKLAYDEVVYWNELKEIIEWAQHNVYSTMYICWAAQAAMYHLYGIDKNLLPKKVFGIFEHKVIDRANPLVRGFDEHFAAPHSRYTEINSADVYADDRITVLAVSDEAGLYLAASKDLRSVFVFGHGEYDVDTLHREYIRDKEKGLDTDPPKHYYENGLDSLPQLTWRAHESLLFMNWLNYCVYQITPYDIEKIK